MTGNIAKAAAVFARVARRIKPHHPAKHADYLRRVQDAFVASLALELGELFNDPAFRETVVANALWITGLNIGRREGDPTAYLPARFDTEAYIAHSLPFLAAIARLEAYRPE